MQGFFSHFAQKLAAWQRRGWLFFSARRKKVTKIVSAFVRFSTYYWGEKRTPFTSKGLEVHTNTESIIPQMLIITCEFCREVRYLDAANEEDVIRQFNAFRCRKGCDRSYYSYITVGQLVLGTPENQIIADTVVVPKKINHIAS